MAVIVCSYASSDFDRSARLLSSTVSRLGFDEFILFRYQDLDPEFRMRNSETLNFRRGAGYWIWKPQIISQVLNKTSARDTVLYLDCGAVPKIDARQFEEIAQDNLIHLWQEPSELQLNKYWIDESVISFLNCDTQILERPHYWAGAICSKNTLPFRDMINSWSLMCQDSKLLRPDSYPKYLPGKSLIWHRHDQSLLNIMVQQSRKSFFLHSNSESYNYSEIFIHHRRGYISNRFQLHIYICLRHCYRFLINLLPLRSALFVRKVRSIVIRKNLSTLEKQRDLKLLINAKNKKG